MPAKANTTDDFAVPCVQAAAMIGISAKMLNRKAEQGLVECRIKGLNKVPRRFFRKRDVDRLRDLYQVGLQPRVKRDGATC